MSFCSSDADNILKFFNNDGDGITESEKQTQRTLTVEYVLEFLKESLS